MGDLDIGGILGMFLPFIDYYLTFFTRLLETFAATLGFDLALTPDEPAEPETPEAVQ